MTCQSPRRAEKLHNATRTLCQAFTEVSTFMTQLYDYDSTPSYGILDQNGQIVYDLDYLAINYAIDEPITSTPCKDVQSGIIRHSGILQMRTGFLCRSLKSPILLSCPELLTVSQIINLLAPTSHNAAPSGINGSSAPTPPSSPPSPAATLPTSTEIPHGNRRR